MRKRRNTILERVRSGHLSCRNQPCVSVLRDLESASLSCHFQTSGGGREPSLSYHALGLRLEPAHEEDAEGSVLNEDAV